MVAAEPLASRSPQPLHVAEPCVSRRRLDRRVVHPLRHPRDGLHSRQGLHDQRRVHQSSRRQPAPGLRVPCRRAARLRWAAATWRSSRRWARTWCGRRTMSRTRASWKLPTNSGCWSGKRSPISRSTTTAPREYRKRRLALHPQVHRQLPAGQQEMIRRDRNHPSIIIWGIGDDLTGYPYIEDLRELHENAHRLDPNPVDSRPGVPDDHRRPRPNQRRLLRFP